MAAIIFIEPLQPGAQFDKLMDDLEQQTNSVAYTYPNGTGNVEAYFNSAAVDASQARQSVIDALDGIDPNWQQIARVLPVP